VLVDVVKAQNGRAGSVGDSEAGSAAIGLVDGRTYKGSLRDEDSLRRSEFRGGGEKLWAVPIPRSEQA
jgi:hypothetical protein